MIEIGPRLAAYLKQLGGLALSLLVSWGAYKSIAKNPSVGEWLLIVTAPGGTAALLMTRTSPKDVWDQKTDRRSRRRWPDPPTE